MNKTSYPAAAAAAGAVLVFVLVFSWHSTAQGPSRVSAPATCIAGCAPLIPGMAPMTPAQMVELRTRAWKLLPLLAVQNEGMPDRGYWTPLDKLLPPPPGVSPAAAGSAGKSQALWALHTPVELADVSTVTSRYESTFFNPIATEFIKRRGLRKNVAPELVAANVRDIEFPSGSVTLKTFWYLIEPGKKTDVKIWDWRNPSLLDEKDVCVTIESGTGCDTTDEFYRAKVTDPAQFVCNACPSLKAGQHLILVGAHLASKQMPDWFWATYWWRGRDDPATSGTDWTCNDAQREAAIGQQLGRLIPAWKNYSMDVTASFRIPKPRLADNAPCGKPKPIGRGDEYLAAYNPFVEALIMPNGLKSNCIDCHARADSDAAAGRQKNTVMDPGMLDPYILLSNFEGHLRTDYVWSLSHSQVTTFPAQNGWPPPQ